MDRKQLDLEDERTTQRRYRRILQDKASRTFARQGPHDNLRTRRTGLPRGPVMPWGALVGRVALRQPDPDHLGEGGDFYIGEAYAEVDGLYVFSWAAPVACTFFRGSRHHELCDKVAVVRSFEHRGDDIVAFYDEQVSDEIPAHPFRRRELTVPAAPNRRNVPRPPASRAAPSAHSPAVRTVPQKPAVSVPNVGSTSPVGRRGMPAPPVLLAGTATSPAPPPARPTSPAARPGAPAPHPAAQAKHPAVAPVRAEALLRARLAAPRTKSLAPVLATLQPDQYNLVTVPAMDSMIIEGQPGTGKTIIASHRAAYLVNDETPAENTLDGRVLLVGPTDGYSRHVRTVIDRLAGESDRVWVLSLPELMLRILDIQRVIRGPVSRSWRDADKDLCMFARAAVTRLKSSGAKLTRDHVYEYLRRNGDLQRPLTRDPEWVSYLRRLPPAHDALTMRQHIPLLATIQWEIAKPRDLVGIEHIIVDEAQDVTSLEWLLLAAMNEAHAWTLVGDMNQRRSDHTPASWAQVLRLLDIPYGDPPVRRLERGYRSTRPILEFANRLLPAAARTVLAFQDQGPEPIVEKCHRSALEATVLRHLRRLQDAYPRGTLAIITADPKTVESMLRSADWVMSDNSTFTWQRSGREVTVAHPDTARGLEFDAVIVVEPADFPQNLGRQGPLYTALTRPNRELAVIHTKPLPERLRKSSGHRRSSR